MWILCFFYFHRFCVFLAVGYFYTLRNNIKLFMRFGFLCLVFGLGLKKQNQIFKWLQFCTVVDLFVSIKLFELFRLFEWLGFFGLVWLLWTSWDCSVRQVSQQTKFIKLFSDFKSLGRKFFNIIWYKVQRHKTLKLHFHRVLRPALLFVYYL